MNAKVLCEVLSEGGDVGEILVVCSSLGCVVDM